MNDFTTPTRICGLCGNELPLTAEFFYRNKLHSTGFHSNCKLCSSAKQRDWRERNKERKRESGRVWYQANRERCQSRNKQNYQEKSEEYKKRAQQWRLNNPERKKQNARDWHIKNRRTIIEKVRLWRLNNPQKRRESNLRYHEKHRDDIRKQHLFYRQKHRDELLAKGRAYYQAHIEARRAKSRAHAKENRERYRENLRNWRKNNPEMNRAAKARRRALEHNAAGSHTGMDIICIYNAQNGKCAYCGIELHKQYHVDHIIPLSRGGSNYPANLACTCKVCNLSKSDKMIDEWIKFRGW